jgi:pimeloyl-ACP methyl ester carboxylesterase
MPEIQVTQGTIRYREVGSGPAVVLIHGVLVNGTVWDRVVEALSPDVRVIVPDLPLGSHRIAMKPGADLSPLGLARLISELLERLELEDVTLVGNDTGGALCQLTVIHHPQRVGRLVLTNCDAFENFPPPAFKALLTVLGRVPGALMGLAQLGRSRRMRAASMKLTPLTMTPVPDELLSEWVSPLRDRHIRRDAAQVLRGIDPRYTLDAAKRLPEFERPALLAWGVRDPFFRVRDAERLASVLPCARLERIPDARTFVQLDAPERLAELIAEMGTAPNTALAERS